MRYAKYIIKKDMQMERLDRQISVRISQSMEIFEGVSKNSLHFCKIGIQIDIY